MLILEGELLGHRSINLKKLSTIFRFLLFKNDICIELQRITIDLENVESRKIKCRENWKEAIILAAKDDFT